MVLYINIFCPILALSLLHQSYISLIVILDHNLFDNHPRFIISDRFVDAFFSFSCHYIGICRTCRFVFFRSNYSVSISSCCYIDTCFSCQSSSCYVGKLNCFSFSTYIDIYSYCYVDICSFNISVGWYIGIRNCWNISAAGNTFFANYAWCYISICSLGDSYRYIGAAFILKE